MRIFNQNKTEELFNCDYSKGYTLKDVLITHIKGQKYIKEEGHYEIIKEYPNGGTDVEWVIDVKGQDEILDHDEKEDILVYIEYTKDELKYINNKHNIDILKKYLESTDYIITKIFEKKFLGLDISTDLIKYNNIIKEREKKRIKINLLENECLKFNVSNYVGNHN